MITNFNKIISLGLLITTLAFGFEKVGTTSFQFLKVGMSARSTGMGEAYSVAVFGADAVFWNPGALTTVRRFDVEASYMDYFFDVKHTSLAIGWNAGTWGVLGFQALLTDVGEIEETTVSQLGFNENDVYMPGLTGNTFSPGAMVLGVSWARSLTEQFSFGITTKFVREDLWLESASAVVFDGGLIYNTGFRTVQISAVVRHFGQNVAFIDKDFPLPQTFNIGISGFLMGPSANLGTISETHSVQVAFDMVQPRDYDQQYNVGLEYGFSNLLFLRGGYKMNYDEEGIALGMGMNYKGYRFDYSYNDYGDLLSGVHRFSVGLSLQ